MLKIITNFFRFLNNQNMNFYYKLYLSLTMLQSEVFVVILGLFNRFLWYSLRLYYTSILIRINRCRKVVNEREVCNLRIAGVATLASITELLFKAFILFHISFTYRLARLSDSVFKDRSC